MRIIGIRHDNKVGGGEIGITLELAPLCYGTATGDRIGMEASNTSANGWNGSRMRVATLVTYRGQLPADLRAILKTAIKPTATSGVNPTLINSNDDISLLSEREVFGSNANSAAGEGERYLYYSVNNTNAARIKEQPSGSNIN